METSTAVVMLAALAQPCRLDAFRLLVQAGETGITAGELARACAVPPSTLSFHLRALTRAGLVRADNQGRHIVYRAELAIVQALLDFLTENCCRGAACAVEQRTNPTILRETLNKAASGMKRKAHGAQRPRHNNELGEGASTAQRSDSPAQPFIQRFLSPSRALSRVRCT